MAVAWDDERTRRVLWTYGAKGLVWSVLGVAGVVAFVVAFLQADEQAAAPAAGPKGAMAVALGCFVAGPALLGAGAVVVRRAVRWRRLLQREPWRVVDVDGAAIQRAACAPWRLGRLLETRRCWAVGQGPVLLGVEEGTHLYEARSGVRHLGA
jgi:hypothetical protein